MVLLTSEIVRAPAVASKLLNADSRTPEWSSTQLAVSRILDVMIATLLLILSLPLMLIVAVLVSVTSKGPVLYLQQRVGAGGVHFTMRKFRTMRVGTDLEIQTDPEQWKAFSNAAFKLPADDPRITQVGRWLRKLSLDELPQLLDVLRGSMSLVGIRPLVPRELAARPDDYQALYCLRRPGITGRWQVNGRSLIDDAGRLECDREYIATWSVWNDFRLLIRTPLAVLQVHQAR